MKRLIFLACLLATPAFAQQQPDPAMQRLLDAIAVQRNQASNQAASCEARSGGLSDDLAKALARIKELESHNPPAAPGK